MQAEHDTTIHVLSEGTAAEPAAANVACLGRQFRAWRICVNLRGTLFSPRSAKRTMSNVAVIMPAAGASRRFRDKNYKKAVRSAGWAGSVAAFGREVSQSFGREAGDRGDCRRGHARNFSASLGRISLSWGSTSAGAARSGPTRSKKPSLEVKPDIDLIASTTPPDPVWPTSGSTPSSRRQRRTGRQFSPSRSRPLSNESPKARSPRRSAATHSGRHRHRKSFVAIGSSRPTLPAPASRHRRCRS